MLAPNIVIDITFHRFEEGQKLVRSRSNYLAHDGQRALRVYIFENRRENEPFAHISLSIRVVTRTSISHLIFLSGRNGIFIISRVVHLSPS